jgi:hypothetical protein
LQSSLARKKMDFCFLSTFFDLEEGLVERPLIVLLERLQHA